MPLVNREPASFGRADTLVIRARAFEKVRNVSFADSQPQLCFVKEKIEWLLTYENREGT